MIRPIFRHYHNRMVIVLMGLLSLSIFMAYEFFDVGDVSLEQK